MVFLAPSYISLKIQRYSISCIKEAMTEFFHLKYSCYFKEERKNYFLSGAKKM